MVNFEPKEITSPIIKEEGFKRKWVECPSFLTKEGGRIPRALKVFGTLLVKVLRS